MIALQLDPIDLGLELKQARLRRMQWFATSLLGAMLVLLVMSATYETAYPWLQWVHAFAEAATVGAIADWFAVVALFQHPLGLPIPHTAIIPNNKDRMGEGLGQFVEHNFLTAENVTRKLEEHNLAEAIAAWLIDPANSRKLAARACVLISALLDALEDEDLKHFFDRTVTPLLSKLDVARIAGNILTMLTADNRHQVLLDRALVTFEDWLTANQGLIKAKFAEASKYTPGFLDSYIVNKFVEGIIALLHEVANDREHPMRREFDQATRDFIDKLKTSSEYRQKGEALKRQFLDHLKRENYYRVLWSDIKLRVLADITAERSLVREYIENALVALGNGLLDDPALQRKLNAWMLKAIEELMLRHRHQISGLITKVVKQWDAQEVAQKVELEVGKDLQFIRINGTLVGGTVGLLLHGTTAAIW